MRMEDCIDESMNEMRMVKSKMATMNTISRVFDARAAAHVAACGATVEICTNYT